MAAVSEAETNDDSETLTHLSEKTPRNRDPEEDRHTHTECKRERDRDGGREKGEEREGEWKEAS